MVAAGLDGIRNKLEPGPMDVVGDRAILLPMNLTEAVEAFEADSQLNSMFGEEFTRWFCQMKRQTDCKLDSFEEEKKKYWKLI